MGHLNRRTPELRRRSGVKKQKIGRIAWLNGAPITPHSVLVAQDVLLRRHDVWLGVSSSVDKPKAYLTAPAPFLAILSS